MNIQIIINQKRITMNYFKKKIIKINLINLINFFQLFVVILMLILGTTKLNSQIKVGLNPKTLAPNALFEIEPTSGNSAIFTKDSAFLGLGTLTPTRRLEIQNATPGAIKIVDGTQGFGKVLTSDSNGVAIWATPFSITPANLTNSNGIIVTGGTGATLTATSLRLDSSVVAQMLGQSPTKDSLAIALSKSPIKDSLASQTTQLINSGAVTGKDLTNSNGIIVTGGTGATLSSTSLRLDSSVVAQMLDQSPVKDSLATALSKSPIKDSLASQTTQLINSGAVTGKDLTNSNGIIVIDGIGTTLKSTSLRLDSTAVAKMITQSPVKDSLLYLLFTQNIGVKNVNVTIPQLSLGEIGAFDLTIIGAEIGDNIVVNPRSPLPFGVAIAYSLVLASNQVSIGFTGTGSHSSVAIPFDIKIIK